MWTGPAGGKGAQGRTVVGVELVDVELFGPGTFDVWRQACSLITGLVSWKAVSLGRVQLDESMMERCSSRSGPSVWHLLYQADVTARAEHVKCLWLCTATTTRTRRCLGTGSWARLRLTEPCGTKNWKKHLSCSSSRLCGRSKSNGRSASVTSLSSWTGVLAESAVPFYQRKNKRKGKQAKGQLCEAVEPTTPDCEVCRFHAVLGKAQNCLSVLSCLQRECQ